MQERLDTPSYGERPIALACAEVGATIEISIRDWGAGFVPLMVGEPKRLSGRGLNLMAGHSDGLRHEDGGRRVVLSFNRHPAHG